MASLIEDTVILALAKEIPNDKLDDLGVKLGSSLSATARFRSMNHAGGTVTWLGTQAMLTDWRDRTPQDQQRPNLEEALKGADLVRLVDLHLGGTATGEAATTSEQVARSETKTHSGQPSPRQTQNGVTNTIRASGSSTVLGNTMIGQQTNVYKSPPSAPDVHHHNTTVVHHAPPIMPVYRIPHVQATKRQANLMLGPAPKRQKVTQAGPSTSKAKSSKPIKKSSTSQRNSATKSSGNPLHTTKRPATPGASKKKTSKNQKATKAPKIKAPKTAATKKKSQMKKPKVTKKNPLKTKQPKTQKSKTSGRVRPKNKPKKSRKK